MTSTCRSRFGCQSLTWLTAAPPLCPVLLALASSGTPSQGPALPAGARTRWIVADPHEIVVYVTFDPARVERERPRTLRFITIDELAAGEVRWAADYLARHPAHRNWGISFLEIIRAGTFTIDGRTPDWRTHRAAALWCARVAPSDPTADVGPGRLLRPRVLGARPGCTSPTYAAGATTPPTATSRSKTMWPAPGGDSIDTGGLAVTARCVPSGAVTGGAGSAGAQVLFPPLSSGMRDIVRVAFAGHRERECGDGSSWQLRGIHPLAGGVVLEPSVLQFERAL